MSLLLTFYVCLFNKKCKNYQWKKALYEELNERAEAVTSSYSTSTNFLQYIYSVLVTKTHQKIRSICLVHEFSFIYIFLNNMNHGYRAAILKKHLWLLSYYLTVVTYFYYEKVHKMMCTAIASYFLREHRYCYPILNRSYYCQIS